MVKVGGRFKLGQRVMWNGHMILSRGKSIEVGKTMVTVIGYNPNLMVMEYECVIAGFTEHAHICENDMVAIETVR